MNNSITREEIAETFTPVLEEIPHLLQIITGCLTKELSTFEHDKARMWKERQKINLVTQIVQKKWTLELIYLLLIHESLYFNEIKQYLPKISNNVLAQRLKSLVQYELIAHTKIKQSKSIRTNYALSDLGRKFAMLLIPAFLLFIHQKDDILTNIHS